MSNYIKVSKNNLSDLFCRIRNGYLAGKRQISVVKTKLNKSVLLKLKELGFLLDYQEGLANELLVNLSYTDKYEPALKILKTYRSKYISLSYIKKFVPFNGFGNYIISTNCGILSNIEALEKNTGGLLLCEVF